MQSFNLHALLVVAIVGLSAMGTQGVDIEIFSEPGCPDTQLFLGKVLKETLGAEGVKDIVDVSFTPFGNAVFETELCSGEDVGCFFQKCGAAVKEAPVECFTGKMTCTNGEKECKAMRKLACARGTATGSMFFNLVSCVTNHFEEENSGFESCAGRAGLSDIDIKKINECQESVSGDVAIIAEARKTPPHVDVPVVLVNGKPLADTTSTNGLLLAVCDAHKSTSITLPEGCGSASPLLQTGRGEQAAADTPVVPSFLRRRLC